MIDLIDPKPDNYSITLFNNLSDCRVKSIIDLEDWLSMIKKSDYSDRICFARNNPEFYDIIKVNEIPCVTLNFNYSKYKKGSNCIGSTGLLYIDIDAPDFNIKNIDKSLVRAYYKSFGGNGYGIIVKVEGLSKENFEATYFSVCDKLNILPYVDLGAKKETQFNVLPLDKDLFSNPYSKIFNSISTPLLVTNKRERRAYSTEWGVNNIRFDNKQDFIKDGEDYYINLEGFEIVEAKLLYKKVSKNRNNILLAYCNNIVYLNPNIYFDRLFKIMSAVNQNNFSNPLEEVQLYRVINSVLNYLDDGTLQPIYGKKKRKIVFSNNSSNYKTKEEKFKLVREVNAQIKRNKSISKITEIIKNWDFKELGKITQKAIVKNHSVSKKTVEKYYSIFIDDIKIINSKFGSYV